MSTNEPLIVANHLNKHYTLGETVVKALDDVSIQVNRGDFMAIIGPSGSGKSTLVNMLGGVDTPDSGFIQFEDKNLGNLTATKLTDFRRYNVSFVFQFYSLIPTLTALENVEMAAELIGLKGKELHKEALNMLDAVGLKDRARNYPSQLSGGERQRVAIARALVKHPKLILIDEPTGQLDVQTSQEIIELVRDTCKQTGSTVLMVTHDKTLLKFVDRVVEMQSGTISVMD